VQIEVARLQQGLQERGDRRVVHLGEQSASTEFVGGDHGVRTDAREFVAQPPVGGLGDDA
jgi:hypothetical protein